LTTLGVFIIYDFLKTRKHNKANGETISTANLALRVQALRIPPHSIKIPGIRRLSTYVNLPISNIENISVFIPLAIGFGIGFLAGLLGAGGGFVLMPLLIYVVGIPTTVAIGTDLFQIIITGSVGTFIYSLGNHVDPLMAIVMLTAASLGSQLGASATKIVNPSRIRVLFGITVLSGSVAIGLKQVSSFADELSFLSHIASIVLLGVSGLIALVICFLLIKSNLGKN
jgi:uncharacterized membrane protein YfcA